MAESDPQRVTLTPHAFWVKVSTQFLHERMYEWSDPVQVRVEMDPYDGSYTLVFRNVDAAERELGHTDRERRLYLALWRARGCVSICPDHGVMDGTTSPFLDGIDKLLNEAEGPVAADPSSTPKPRPHMKGKRACDE